MREIVYRDSAKMAARTVVLDNGAYSAKIGFSTDKEARYYILKCKYMGYLFKTHT